MRQPLAEAAEPPLQPERTPALLLDQEAAAPAILRRTEGLKTNLVGVYLRFTPSRRPSLSYCADCVTVDSLILRRRYPSRT